MVGAHLPVIAPSPKFGHHGKRDESSGKCWQRREQGVQTRRWPVGKVSGGILKNADHDPRGNGENHETAEGFDVSRYPSIDGAKERCQKEQTYPFRIDAVSVSKSTIVQFTERPGTRKKFTRRYPPTPNSDHGDR